MENIYTDEERLWLNGDDTKPKRITPSIVNTLDENEIFVFGSNINGMHMGGAARIAYNKFGAEWGNGEGLQGQSYALPTMEGVENIRVAVKHFTDCAYDHPEYKFLVVVGYLTQSSCISRRTEYTHFLESHDMDN